MYSVRGIFTFKCNLYSETIPINSGLKGRCDASKQTSQLIQKFDYKIQKKALKKFDEN